MKKSRDTQRELDNESPRFHKERDEGPIQKNVPMAYLVREFQKSLNNGRGDTESAIRKTEGC